MYRLLIADDDQTMLQMIEGVLVNEGYDVTPVITPQAVLEIIDEQDFDLFLIDLSLTDQKGQGGLDLCTALREHPDTQNKPILFLTGHHEVDLAVRALETGADDYIRKPFAVRELTARVRAHLRRVVLNDETSAVIRMNPDTFSVLVDLREVSLTRIEFDLLRFMSESPRKWFGAQDLLAGVWNYPDGVGDAALVRNHVRNLRRKIEKNPDHPHIIQSRHGRGYTLVAHVQMDYAL